MNITQILEDLLAQVNPNTDQQYILYMLWKQSNQLAWATDEHYAPLVDLKASRITLVYQDEELDGLVYPISDHEEILLVLQFLLQSKQTIYLRYTAEENKIPKEILLQKIDEALDKSDADAFQTLTRQLKQWYI